MRTNVYVDGFNLFYGALKGTSCKWLDLHLLFQTVLGTHHNIRSIKYFTARVSGTPVDPSKPQRQDVYLRALQRFRPHTEVHYGHFLTHKIWAHLVRPAGRQHKVEVLRTQEKGSDVNLAVHVVNDAWLDAYDCAVVVTNDSDISEALSIVKQHCSKRIGLLTPGTRRPSRQLLSHADFSRNIRRGVLRSSQLPNPIPGTNIRKPSNW